MMRRIELLVWFLLAIGYKNGALATRNRRPSLGAPGTNRQPQNSEQPLPLTLTEADIARAGKFFAGAATEGILPDWESRQNLENAPDEFQEEPALMTIRQKQLSGNFGIDNRPPRRLLEESPIQIKSSVAPSQRIRNKPASIREISDRDKQLIATTFFTRYRYNEDENMAGIGTSESLITLMQDNYGIPKTGQLDEQTLAEMVKPRCANKDPKAPAAYKTFASNIKWQKDNVTYFIAGYSPDLSQCHIRNSFRKAFRVWEQVIPKTFTMVNNRSAADMIIYFGYGEHGDGYPFDSANGLLAHAFPPGLNPIDGDIHFDEAEFWTDGEGEVYETFFGNANGGKCVFPFIYEGQKYKACTTAGRSDGLPWCATSSNYDNDHQYGFCPHENLFTYGGNGDNNPCVFPFTFLGKQYDSCTTEGRSDGYKWCSTTPNFDEDKKYAFCPKKYHVAEGGNDDGQACHFPFIFQGNSYSACTTVGRNDYLLWCSTTPNFDDDGKYGFCKGDGYSLFMVAAHEFGHAIGLDHSNQLGALMYPVYSYKHSFQLPDDDVRGVQSLYGGRSSRRPLKPLELEQCGGDLSVTDGDEDNGGGQTTPSPGGTDEDLGGGGGDGGTDGGTDEGLGDDDGYKLDCMSHTRPQKICDCKIDAVMLLQAEYIIFQGRYIWRVPVDDTRRTSRHTLLPRDNYWPGFSNERVTAAFKRADGKTMLFAGREHYVYSNDRRIDGGYPKPNTVLGFDRSTEIDAAVQIKFTRKDGKKPKPSQVFMFNNTEVLRTHPDGVNNPRPKRIYLGRSGGWRKLPPQKLQTAFMYKFTKPYTMFLSDDRLYRMQNNKGKVDKTYSLEFFFNCVKSKNLPLPLKAPPAPRTTPKKKARRCRGRRCRGNRKRSAKTQV